MLMEMKKKQAPLPNPRAYNHKRPQTEKEKHKVGPLSLYVQGSSSLGRIINAKEPPKLTDLHMDNAQTLFTRRLSSQHSTKNQGGVKFDSA